MSRSIKEVPGIVIPEPKVEVIAENRKKDSHRFGLQDSSIEGVRFVTEGNGQVNFGRNRTRRLQADGDRIARAKKYADQAKPAKKRLEEASREEPTFAGIESDRGGYRIPVYPVDKNTQYDPELLEQSAGWFHTVIVRETGRLVVEVPLTFYDNRNDDLARRGKRQRRRELEEFARSVAELLVTQRGVSPEDAGNFVSPTIVQRLDEELMNRLIAEGKMGLAPGTKTSDESWQAPVRTLRSRTTPRRQRNLTTEG